ncbi:putative gmp synthase [Phaeomoniella chlamydospora]|uniref:Putative gmp synthase n=1 Tax=Phaeomoniella chlamydospora TaxID=158046 RepID=A0A0G2EJN3_PHACM|nr:putative gmp synthase [Phaeomoniella chlamydospora]
MRVHGWDTVKEVYPPSLETVDAIIVSGSPYSTYQDLKWIQRLELYIRYIYGEHPNIKIYGSCFGHQIICQALFGADGAVVEKNNAGWELGVHEIKLSDKFAARFQDVFMSTSMHLQFLHGDHVILPSENLPNDVYQIGTTPLCPVQGIYQPCRLLTFQGHPEFDRFINTECLKLVGKRVGWEDDYTYSAILRADAMDDANVAADIMISFFLESNVDV